MNQILITEKLYITPELKRKKKFYKVHFFLSVFLICILISVGIYAEYDRSHNAEASQDILGDFNSGLEDILDEKRKALIVVLDDAVQSEQIAEETQREEEEIPNQEQNINSASQNVNTTKTGYSYKTIANINIPKISVNYAITDGLTHSVEETDALLKESITKFWGPDPNTPGNFCLVGHNYKDTRFFGKVPTLENGDIIEITDASNKTVQYSVFTKYEVLPEDVDCLSQPDDGSTQITLITCTDNGKRRVVVKAKAI